MLDAQQAESAPVSTSAEGIIQNIQLKCRVEALTEIQQQAVLQALLPVLQNYPDKQFVTITEQAQVGGSALVCFVELRQSAEQPTRKLVVKTVLEGAVAHQIRSIQLELFIRKRLEQNQLTATLPTRTLAMSEPPTWEVLNTEQGSHVLPKGQLGVSSYSIVTEFVESNIDIKALAFVERVDDEFRISTQWEQKLAFLQDIFADYGQALEDLLKENVVLHDLKLDNLFAIYVDTLNAVQILLPDLGSATVLLEDGSSVPEFPALAGYAGLPLPTSDQLTNPDITDAEKFPAINFETAQYLSKLNFILAIWQNIFGQVHRHLKLSPIESLGGYDASGELGTIATLNDLAAAAMAYDAIGELILTAPQPVSDDDLSLAMILEKTALKTATAAEPINVSFEPEEREIINKTLQLYLILLLDPNSLTPAGSSADSPEELLAAASSTESIVHLAEEISTLLQPSQIMRLSYIEIANKLFEVVIPFLTDYVHTRPTA